jgi:hypothetical protein
MRLRPAADESSQAVSSTAAAIGAAHYAARQDATASSIDQQAVV